MSTVASVPLEAPLYGASFGQVVARFFRKYTTFSGRASRSEFWWWQVATTVVYMVLGAVSLGLAVASGELNADGDTFYLGPAFGVGIALLAIWALVTLVPQIAVTVRRLHDANLSGWFVLLRLLPSASDVIVLVLTLMPSVPAGSRFDRR